MYVVFELIMTFRFLFSFGVVTKKTVFINPNMFYLFNISTHIWTVRKGVEP